jgi:hypothetical protein
MGPEQTKMSAMSKVRGAQFPASEPAMKVVRRRRAVLGGADPNDAFARAFVDALRDILHEEMRVVP